MFYLQLQVIQDRTLQGDKHETRRGAAATSVRVSEDLPQSLPSPVPKLPAYSLSQHLPYTPTDTASTVGRLFNCTQILQRQRQHVKSGGEGGAQCS